MLNREITSLGGTCRTQCDEIASGKLRPDTDDNGLGHHRAIPKDVESHADPNPVVDPFVNHDKLEGFIGLDQPPTDRDSWP